MTHAVARLTDKVGGRCTEMGHISRCSRVGGRVSAALLCSVLLSAAATAQRTLDQALRLQAQAQAVAGRPRMISPMTDAVAQPATTEEALHALADQAAVIFVGVVKAVRQENAVVRVEFQVEDGIRGTVTGGTYALQEWAGLWSPGAPRYTVGQRALLLLHAPSAAGFSSPVGGADGVVPITGDVSSGTSDLRWVAARSLRSVTIRKEKVTAFMDEDALGPVVSAKLVAAAVSEGGTLQGRTAAKSGESGTAWSADPVAGNVLGQDVHAIEQGLVTGLLRAWTPRKESR